MAVRVYFHLSWETCWVLELVLSYKMFKSKSKLFFLLLNLIIHTSIY